MDNKMLVTVIYDIVERDTKILLHQYDYVDVEITEEEYKLMEESFLSDKYHSMSDDPHLEEICSKCKDVIRLCIFEPTEAPAFVLGDVEDDVEFIIYWPLEITEDNSLPSVWSDCFGS